METMVSFHLMLRRSYGGRARSSLCVAALALVSAPVSAPVAMLGGRCLAPPGAATMPPFISAVAVGARTSSRCSCSGRARSSSLCGARPSSCRSCGGRARTSLYAGGQGRGLCCAVLAAAARAPRCTLAHVRSSRPSPPSMFAAAGDGVRLPEATRRQLLNPFRGLDSDRLTTFTHNVANRRQRVGTVTSVLTLF